MKHRIFIAISLPENIKKRLFSYQEKWPELPAKWVKRDNIHITLSFLGYISDEELLEICKTAEKTASKHQPFLINLTKICYAPIGKIPPRMVWAQGEESEELSSLQNDLEKTLFESTSPAKNKENRHYTPHITLARIRQWEWRKIEPEERPEIEEDISFNFEINSIEVMESELKRKGPEYTILKTCELKLD